MDRNSPTSRPQASPRWLQREVFRPRPAPLSRTAPRAARPLLGCLSSGPGLGCLGLGPFGLIQATVRSSSEEGKVGAGRAHRGRQPSVLVAPETWRQARQRLAMSMMATRDAGGGSAWGGDDKGRRREAGSKGREAGGEGREERGEGG